MEVKPKIPGLPRDEFVKKYGEAALRQVPSTHIISWGHVVYILDNWNQEEGDVS